MEHIHIQRKGDPEKLYKYRDLYKAFNNEELIERYNGCVDTGIVGVHEQALHLISLKWVFHDRFGKSPIKIKDNVLISLSGKIVLEGENYTEIPYVSLHLTNDHINHVYTDSIIESDSGFIDVKSYLKEDSKALLFRFSQDEMNTQLVLTNVTPYVILFFDNELYFKGASYSINVGSGSYTIQTQYKNILFVRMPHDLQLNEIISLKV